MESWQKSYIDREGAQLIDLIQCSHILIEKLVGQSIISRGEQEQLETAIKYEGNSKASQDLLKILRTRINAYDILIQVLNELKQTGAVQVLEKGIQQHSPAFSTIRLQNEILRYCLLTIPESLDYYVSRSLLSRRQLFRRILTNTSDVLVLRGIGLNDMDNLTGSFDKSSNELQRRELKYNRIILDNEDHFEKICKKTKSAVHLLNYQDKRLVWVKSHGGFDCIHENVHPDQDRLSEEDFVANCLENGEEQSVCISDTPGMGKTILLAKIARIIAQTRSQDVIIFLILREFMEDLHITVKRGQTMEERHLFSAIEKTLKKKSSGEPKFTIFYPDTSYHLMLDGFDEILRDHWDVAKAMLKFILKHLKNVRIWITTRPHLLHELENTLGVLGYNVLPFQRDNQVSFLRMFWVGKGAVMNERLDFYSDKCLTALNNQTSKTDREVTGIPLQCRMLGHVFEDDAVGYSKSSSTHVFSPVASFIEMYDKFVESQSEKFRRNCDGSPEMLKELTEVHTKLAVGLLFPDLIEVFDEFALSLEGRNFYGEVCNSGVVERRSPNESPKFIHQTFAEYFVAKRVIDILNDSVINSKFSSKSTSEFWEKVFKILDIIFAAEKTDSWYVRLDLQKSRNPSYNFKYPTLCYFINTLLHTTQEFRLPAKVTVPDKHLPRIREWIPAAVEGNLLEILKLFDLIFPASSKMLYLFDKKEVHVSLMTSSIGSASIDLVEYVSKWVETWGETSLSSLQPHRPDWWQLEFLEYVEDFREGNEIPFDYSLAGYAAAMGSYLMFNFLFTLFHLNNWIGSDLWGASALLRCVLNDSALSTSDVIEEKKQIVKRILATNKTILERLEKTWKDVHLNIHTELAIFFLEEAWKIHPEVRLGPLVLHQTLECASSQGKVSGHDFHTLMAMLHNKGFVYKEINTMKLLKKRSMLHAVVTLVDEVQNETLEIFSQIGADFNSVDADGYSVLQLAKLSSNDRVVGKLKELGAIDKFLTFSRIKRFFKM